MPLECTITEMISIIFITWVDAADCGGMEAMVLDGSPSYSRPTYASIKSVLVNMISGPICSYFGIFWISDLLIFVAHPPLPSGILVAWLPGGREM